MNEVKIFNNAEFGQIRTVEKDGQIMFVGKDIAEVLGYERATKAVNDHVDIEDIDEVPIQDSIGRMQKTPVINESGLYSLIISSKLPQAKQFKRWVTSEVLPSIRKNGMYATDELLDNPDLLIQVATQLRDERERRRHLEAEREANSPKVLFADSVSTSKQSILVGDLAKLIKQNGINIGQNRLFEWLRNNGYLMSRRGESYNMPTQRSMELGLFEVKESVHNNPDGSSRLTRTTKVTGKGQIYFINKLVAPKQ